MEILSKLAQQAVATPSRRAAAVSGAFVIAAVTKHVLVTTLIYFHSARFYLRAQDAVLTGALAALMVWALLEAVAARQRYVRKQIEVVANLNHELRNALQVIIGSEYLPKTDKANAILESVERINQNLSKLLGH